MVAVIVIITMAVAVAVIVTTPPSLYHEYFSNTFWEVYKPHPHNTPNLINYPPICFIQIASIGTGKKEEKKGSFASASHSHSAQEGEEGEDAMDVAGSSKDGKQKGQGKGQGLAQGLGLGPGKVKDFRQGVRSLEEFVSLPSDPMTGSDEEEEGGDEDVAVSGSAGVSAKARTETGAKGGIGASRNTHKKRRTEEGKEAAPVVGVDEGIVTEGKGSGKTKVTKNKAATTTTATAATAPAPAAAKGSQKKGGKK